MSTNTFFAELKRRHVYRVAVAYVIVAWLLLQLASIVFPAFSAPAWVMKAIMAMLAIGFPIALVLAWASDVTPQDIERVDADGDTAAPATPSRSRSSVLAAGLIGVVIAIVAAGGYEYFEHVATVSRAGATRSAIPSADQTPASAAAAAVVPAKSIAVLPFENMSEDKANDYFAEGMQDMILTRLADIGELKVISRTSTERYKSHPDSLKNIARQLGVATILEGSVQKAGDQVLINVQLIDARSDSHLWAQAYTRTLDNIFGVEGEVAQKIAQALDTTLTRGEQQTLATKPTQNADAYDAYLRGLAASLSAESTADEYRQAAGFYAEAVEHDPGFSLAWAQLAQVDSRIYQLHYDRSRLLGKAAKNAADAALRLAPDSGEAWLARGIYLYRVESNYAAATAALTQARQRLPNNGEVLAAFADIEARQGRWDAALAHIDEVSRIDPRNTHLLLLHAQIHGMRREFPDALELLRHALGIAPHDASLIAYEAAIALAEGKPDQAQALLAPLPSMPGNPFVFKTRVMLWIYQHRYSEAIQALQAAVAEPQSSLGSDLGDYDYLLGFAHQMNHDPSAARPAYQAARNKLEAMQGGFPDDPGVAADLGLVHAGLGDAARALALGERAVKLQPSTSDATLGPAWEEQLARIEAQAGETDRALIRLQRLLRIPYFSVFYGTAITPALLRQDPVWDPLRGDPRFKVLLQARP